MIRTVAVSIAILCTPVAATAAEPAAVELVQPGDAAKSCDVLATEINALATAETKPRKKKGFGGFGKLLGMAAPMLGGGFGLGGALAGQAAAVAQQGAMEATMRDQTDAAMAAINPGASIEAQRKTRLMTYFEQKGC